MAQQTAVEWLAEQLKEYDFSDIKDNEYYILKIPAWILNQKEEQAKQKEKEQITKAWDDGDYAHFYSKETGKDFENGEEYYNETYGK